MMTLWPMVVLTLAILAAVGPMPTHGAVASPHKHEKHTSKERIKDGVYVPRDAHHHGEHGEHNVEFDHEAIIGNTKEAQEFDTLTPEESKRRLAILIRMMDLNKDEYIDRHELKAWILRSFKKLSEEEAADRFEEIDLDGDDKITWKEYLLDTYAMEDEDFKKEVIDFDSYEDEQNMIKQDKEMFNAADVNKDGVLTMEEYVYFQNPEEHPQMLPILLEHTMQDKDTNHDGKIDFQEYVGQAAAHHDKEWLVTEKERFDKDHDINGDGMLTGNEVLSWIVPSNTAIASDEVDHLFVSTDEDHDDRLSYLEILNNYDTFVGSEATDYGDHLQNINHLSDEL
ncbi:reticulocalbin-2 [Drosophila sulfurigaster albostrigata]|uniref:Reticulocalbin-3 n=1 Tax=Drosophila albomicans TaxID=7291 RepID=A0A6P8WIC2_DROAB|nr:reticulocalbin-2 [Drosophila albomicans]XP_060645424.1 reticulocalbin-2 [Drosophila nasuta]XP_062135476.1 reticulocalbin-2 [Drosophila sulfurigaster albostrigata]